MAKTASINDLAKKLGVSKTLVSLVLNGKYKENRISEDIAKQVLKLADEMNYKPNQLARSLRLGRTKLIGLVVADISNDFFARMGRSVEDAAAKRGYTTIFCSSDENGEKTEKIVETLRSKQVDGIILTPTIGNKELVIGLKKAGVPFVLFDRYFPNVKTNNVLIDNFEASYRITKHLIDKGYTKIAQLVYTPNLIQMKQRTSGYKAALKENNIRFKREWLQEINFDNLNEDINVAIEKLLSFPINVQALIFSSGKLTLPGLKALNDLNIRIPMDVAVITFDDNEVYQMLPTPLSAVMQPVDEMGQKCVEILLDEIEKKNTEKISIQLPVEFIERKSS